MYIIVPDDWPQIADESFDGGRHKIMYSKSSGILIAMVLDFQGYAAILKANKEPFTSRDVKRAFCGGDILEERLFRATKLRILRQRCSQFGKSNFGFLVVGDEHLRADRRTKQSQSSANLPSTIDLSKESHCMAIFYSPPSQGECNVH